MISKRTANLYIDGTSALKPALDVHEGHRATIIQFPGNRNHEERQRLQLDGRPSVPTVFEATNRLSLKHLLYSVFASSEMLCSLLFEDVRGCPYHLFSRQTIAAASVAAAVFAIACIVIGY